MSANLQRETFRTSRLAEFCGEKELVAQTGHATDEWPLVALKELVDNALDAAEEANIAPEINIKVSTETGEIVIADNGPGIPAETVNGMLDYTTRTSSREAYVSPTRGSQGNALKTVVAMPFGLDETRGGSTVIEARGSAHRIVFERDPVRREPKVFCETTPSLVQNGTRITVRWPEIACPTLKAASGRFVQIASDYATFTPHLTIAVDWDGERVVDEPATDLDWHKWRACDPTSAHWYDTASFGRYIAAHIARDEDQGRSGRTVREFIAELRGLARTDKQKIVLAESDVSGMSLANFFRSGDQAVAGLLRACQRHAKPVAAQELGLIGRDHLLEDCRTYGATEESFKYKKLLGETLDGLPYVVEVAFAHCPDRTSGRRIITGVNFSVGIRNPFRQPGSYGSYSHEGLSVVLAGQEVWPSDPVVLVLHYACPQVNYTDRGKSTISLPGFVGDQIAILVEQVTAAWAKSRKAQQREKERDRREHERRMNAVVAELAEPKRAKNSVVGSGLLHHEIDTAAACGGYEIKDLTVLSPQNDPYRLDTTDGHEFGKWFADQVANLVKPAARVHLRGLFYLIVVKDNIKKPDTSVFTNTDDNWVWLQTKAAKAARWLGYVPFDRIRDERNEPPQLFLPREPPAPGSGYFECGEEVIIPASGAVLHRLSVTDPRGKQPYRIILIGEKSSLRDVLEPIAQLVNGELLLPTGEATDTMIAELAARAAEDGRPAVVLYFADFDPSGWQMPISLSRKLQALRRLLYPDLQIEVHRVALTPDQVKGLPSTPLKKTEKRAERWKSIMRHEQTEIDALAAVRPEELRQIALEAVKPFFDFTLVERCVEASNAWLEEARAKIADHPALAAKQAEIEDWYEIVEEAVDELHQIQVDTHADLKDQLGVDDTDIPAPKAQIEATPPTPLFTTNDDFAAACLKLIAEKKYEGGDDDADLSET
jgi:hypothetical protein